MVAMYIEKNSVIENSSSNDIQGTLFGDSIPELGGDYGFGTKVVQKVTGLTARQIDNWARTGIFAPTLQQAKGSGSRRLYSFKDIIIMKTIKKLSDTGISLQKIRIAIDLLKKRGITDISQVTLCSDGKTIFHVESPEEIYDVLRHGNGVFAICVSSICSETENELKGQVPVKFEPEVIPDAILEHRMQISASPAIRNNYRKIAG